MGWIIAIAIIFGFIVFVNRLGLHPHYHRPGTPGYRCGCGLWVGPIPEPPAILPHPSGCHCGRCPGMTEQSHEGPELPG